MLFPTLEFLIFFAVVFTMAWLLHKRNTARKWFLTVASYFFYGYWDLRFMGLLLQCSLANYAFGRWLQSIPIDKTRKRKIVLAVAVGINLLILGFFKYFGFFMANAIDLAHSLGVTRDIAILEVILPVGISFFTFQGISYVVDIYREDIKAHKKVVDVLLYISFFPQLVAGPIVRAKDFLPQLETKRDPLAIRGYYGLTLILVGLFKKMFLAHYLSNELVTPVFSEPELFSSLDLLFGVYGYAFQIYCDFSAYSDIAIGIAALLGYEFQVNFNQPYRADSLQDFWRRWHISLSSWLRDYLYIPLGGSRLSKGKTYRNLITTMLLGGLWHGAAWNFVIWGALHGSYLAIEKALRDQGLRIKNKALRIFIVFHFVCLCWIFFRAERASLAFEYLTHLMSQWHFDPKITPFAVSLLLLAALTQLVPKETPLHLSSRLAGLPAPVLGVALGSFLMILSALSPDGVLPFIYFQF